jgi:hypothetical protein
MKNKTMRNLLETCFTGASGSEYFALFVLEHFPDAVNFLVGYGHLAQLRRFREFCHNHQQDESLLQLLSEAYPKQYQYWLENE